MEIAHLLEDLQAQSPTELGQFQHRLGVEGIEDVLDRHFIRRLPLEQQVQPFGQLHDLLLKRARRYLQQPRLQKRHPFRAEFQKTVPEIPASRIDPHDDHPSPFHRNFTELFTP